MFLRIKFLLFFVVGLCCIGTYSEGSDLEDIISGGIIVDLREPTFSDGIFSTEKGGVITGENIRIQAQKIWYTRKVIDGDSTVSVVAEGDVMVDYNRQLFVGTKLEYNFVTQRGIIYEGRTSMDPWFLGGDKIELLPDGSFSIKKAFISTSINVNSEWQLSASGVRIKNRHIISAKSVKLRFLKLPIFWLPSFNADMRTLFDSPVKYRVRWGGGQGPRANIRYRAYARDDFRLFLVADYSLRRGWGGGFDTLYESEENKSSFFTKNYVARDRIEKTNRYRFDGVYSRTLPGDTFIDASYDRLSDNEMASDYHDKEFELSTAGLTQVSVWHRNPSWIASGLCRLRVNTFQTIKQELPTVEMSLRPIRYNTLGAIVDSRVRASYIDMEYADGLSGDFEDINSVRLSVDSSIYRPFSYRNALTITPGVGVVGVCYSNSPTHDAKTVGMLKSWLEATTLFSKIYSGNILHTAEPYMRYSYYTSPTIGIEKHYLFDANDAFTKLNIMRVGVRNEIFGKDSDGGISKDLFVDIYGYSFFSAHAFDRTVPKLYGDAIWMVRPDLAFSVKTIWNNDKKNLDRVNVAVDWTWDEDFAAGVEYRSRGRYDWLKADRTNFALETYKEERELLSEFSDKNTTILTKMYYRFAHNWVCSIHSRHTRDRLLENDINEYRINVITLLRINWEVAMSYLHREDEKRVSLRVALPQAKPKSKGDPTTSRMRLL
ncbi:MAG: LPS-assembly protein LptD [Waddliaceae bacterium]|jgi:hypothetical protein|nr:LPS-assembly protein LptD [Waddliaceae bacterium]MBT4444474.1 LPS-assembly protein LptD [Waddliaceae bacterium]MBT6929098.1 LPS-assembly protein LptD [Waddliaceae bacterium]